ncbi:MAG: AAA family ATPase [Candidatus Saccharimonas sp.]
MPLVFSATTQKTIRNLQRTLPHAVLLHGDVGVGLRTTARYIAGESLAGIVEPTIAERQTTESIKVDQIRQLYDITKGKYTTRRVFIIDNADTMVAAAQHALLKLLEEPVNNVHFMLTSHTPQLLLPTILSRVQQYRIEQISTSQSEKLLQNLGVNNSTTMQQLLFLADGKPAELYRLTSDPEKLAAQAAYIKDAQALLTGTVLQKMSVVMSYASSRTNALQLLALAQSLISHTLTKSPSTQLIKTADKLAIAYDNIAANSSVRLQLLLLVL